MVQESTQWFLFYPQKLIYWNIYSRPSFLFCVHIPEQPNRYFATRQTGIREERQLSRLGAAPDKRRHADGWTEGGGGVSDTPGERTFTCLIINAASLSAIVVHASRDTHTKRSTWVHLGRIKAFNNGEGRLGSDAISLDTTLALPHQFVHGLPHNTVIMLSVHLSGVIKRFVDVRGL